MHQSALRARRFTPPWAKALLIPAILLVSIAVHLHLQAPAASAATNRADCEEISGTRYKSSIEREWYLENCFGGDDSGGSFVSWDSDGFIAGYRSASGPVRYLSHILNEVIPCESTNNPNAINYAGPYYGLLQFSPSTWAMSGGGDWFSPWQQGANAARLLRMASPASQWPYCWFS